MALGGSGGMLPRKVFKNLDTVMAILELFEEILWQILFNFFASNSNPSPNMIHYVRTFSIYVKMIVIKYRRFEIMEKLYSSKTALKEYGGGMHHSTQR